MRIVITSDTHLAHDKLGKLEGDVLIHCGDFYNGFRCEDEDLSLMNDWFSKQNFRLKLFVGGNHDFPVQNRRDAIDSYLKDVVYLEDQLFQFEGVSFYGSPWVPDLFGWAYYFDDNILKEVWNLIPRDLDFLITHTPPHGILDDSSRSKGLGCKYLRKRVKHVNPKYHCFGHIHANYGRKKVGTTDYMNVSAFSRSQELNPPVTLDI